MNAAHKGVRLTRRACLVGAGAAPLAASAAGKAFVASAATAAPAMIGRPTEAKGAAVVLELLADVGVHQGG